MQKDHSIWLGCLAALNAATLLVPEDPGGHAGIGTVLTILWLVLGVAWLASCLRYSGPPLRAGLLELLIVLLVGWYMSSGFLAALTKTPRPAINLSWQWAALGVSFLLARQLLRNATAVRAMIVLMIGLSVGLAALGLKQAWIDLPADRIAYLDAADDPQQLYLLTGQWLPEGSAARAQFENRLASNEPVATFALTNSLAGFLAPWFVAGMVIVAAAGARWLPARPRSPSQGWLLCALPLLFVVAVCLFATSSRSALIGTFAGLTVAIVSWLMPGDGRRGWGLVAVVLLAAGALGAIAVLQLNSPAWQAARRSLGFRWEYWQATAQVIADQPMLGCGPGQFQDAYLLHKLPQASEEIQDPHNFLLEVAATAGLPALVILLSILAVAAKCCGPQVTEHQGEDAQTTKIASRRSAGNDDEDEATATKSAKWIVGGGLIGLGVGASAAWLARYPVSFDHLAIVALGLVASWAALDGWVRRGTLDPWLPASALTALVVHLLAAGGISYASNATSFWLLLAMIPVASRTGATLSSRRVSRVGWSTRMALALMIALTVGNWYTQYRPVLTAEHWLASADDGLIDGDLNRSSRALEAAEAADPWSEAVAERQAMARLQAWLALPSSRTYSQLEAANHRLLAVAPESSAAWAGVADAWRRVYRETQDEDDLRAAIDHLSQAIQRYPTRTAYHAAMAELLVSADEPQGAAAAAKRALALDESLREAGHQEKLLDPALRTTVERIAESGEPGDGPLN